MGDIDDASIFEIIGGAAAAFAMKGAAPSSGFVAATP